MSFEYPDDLRFLDSHEYVRVEGEVATLGISAFAIHELGDIVFVELPEVGTEVQQGEEFGSVESVKAVESLYSPISGEIIAANDVLTDAPEQLAADPYGEGWLLKVQLSNALEESATLSASEYRTKVEGQG